jgi:integrase
MWRDGWESNPPGTRHRGSTNGFEDRCGRQALPPKTRRSRRPIVLPQVACEALQRERKQQEAVRVKSTQWSHDFGDLVFTNDRGLPLDASQLGKELRRELEMAGLPCLPFHDLRRSAASLLAFSGVPARVAMEVLGHSQISNHDGYLHEGLSGGSTRGRQELSKALRCLGRTGVTALETSGVLPWDGLGPATGGSNPPAPTNPDTLRHLLSQLGCSPAAAGSGCPRSWHG